MDSANSGRFEQMKGDWASYLVGNSAGSIIEEVGLHRLWMFKYMINVLQWTSKGRRIILNR